MTGGKPTKQPVEQLEGVGAAVALIPLDPFLGRSVMSWIVGENEEEGRRKDSDMVLTVADGPAQLLSLDSRARQIALPLGFLHAYGKVHDEAQKKKQMGE